MYSCEKMVVNCLKFKKIDLDALNFLASYDGKFLCRCQYKEVKGQHSFSYEIETLESLNSLKNNLAFEDFVEIIDAALKVSDLVRNNQLVLGNISLDGDRIFRISDEYKFLYIPVESKKDISIRKFILKLIDVIDVKDVRIQGLNKDVKKYKEDIQVLGCLSSFIESYRVSEQHIDINQSMLEEAGTTLLEEQNYNVEFAESEGETTLFDQAPVQSETEGETTLFDQALVQSETESETSLFNQDGVDSNVSLTGDSGRLTAFYHDASSEYETTVLTSQPEFVEPVLATNLDDEYILVLIRNSTGERIRIERSVFKIGKDESCVDYALHNGSVSRHHATIIYEAGGYYIMDNKSTNGTMIEGIRLQPYEKAELGNGYIISMGNETFQALLERR